MRALAAAIPKNKMPSAPPCDVQLSALALCERRHPREKDLVCKVSREDEKKSYGGESRLASLDRSLAHQNLSASRPRLEKNNFQKLKSGPQRRRGLVPPQAALPARGGRPRRLLRRWFPEQQEQKATGPPDERAEAVPGGSSEARGVPRESERRKWRRVNAPPPLSRKKKRTECVGFICVFLSLRGGSGANFVEELEKKE